MRFGKPEVARAKTLKAKGFPWRPRVGDWYINNTGHCELVRSLDQAQRLSGNGAVFLPSWDDCRHWLSLYDWGDPELDDDRGGSVRMHVTHSDGRVLRTVGASDLDCLYRIILLILMRG